MTNPDITLAPLTAPAVAALDAEIVEHKGIGHPDTLCDALAENFSRGLSRFYLERFGAILHHNVDKALLCGGASRPAFGGGAMIEPIEIHLAGRAVRAYRGVVVPVDEIAIEGSRQWLRQHLTHLDPLTQVRIIPHVRPTSSDLTTLFAGSQRSPLANDTSFGVGFAPLSPLEQAVLAAGRSLNAATTRARHPALGEDIKVMGSRANGVTQLTVACALVDRHVSGLAEYAAARQDAAGIAAAAAQAALGARPHVVVNAADGTAADSLYLTVTGLSAEAGDDGQVGRGNRVNGLLTPYRPMSLEAAAGKNPVTHVGKLYNIMAHRVAATVVDAFPEVGETYCYLLSRIGRPITEPAVFALQLRLSDPALLPARADEIRQRAASSFAAITSLWKEAMAGELNVA